MKSISIFDTLQEMTNTTPKHFRVTDRDEHGQETSHTVIYYRGENYEQAFRLEAARAEAGGRKLVALTTITEEEAWA